VEEISKALRRKFCRVPARGENRMKKKRILVLFVRKKFLKV